MMDKRWYIVHAYSNFEKKVANRSASSPSSAGSTSCSSRCWCRPKRSPKCAAAARSTPNASFPGYVLVKMKLTDEAFHLIKNTPKSATGFLGAENKPMPISEAEAMRILHQVQEGVERPKASVSFKIGENVRVADGPFASFSGVIEEIDEARSRVKVAVSIFGRATPVELEFGPVEKV